MNKDVNRYDNEEYTKMRLRCDAIHELPEFDND